MNDRINNAVMTMTGAITTSSNNITHTVQDRTSALAAELVLNGQICWQISRAVAKLPTTDAI